MMHNISTGKGNCDALLSWLVAWRACDCSHVFAISLIVPAFWRFVQLGLAVPRLEAGL